MTASPSLQDPKAERPVVSAPQPRGGVHTLRGPAQVAVEPELFVGQGYTLGSDSEPRSQHRAKSKLLMEQPGGEVYRSRDRASNAHV